MTKGAELLKGTPQSDSSRLWVLQAGTTRQAPTCEAGPEPIRIRRGRARHPFLDLRCYAPHPLGVGLLEGAALPPPPRTRSKMPFRAGGLRGAGSPALATLGPEGETTNLPPPNLPPWRPQAATRGGRGKRPHLALCFTPELALSLSKGQALPP